MTINTDIVGCSTKEFLHKLDNRWSMAYAAALKDMSETYFDDVIYQPLLVHPLFPVCFEWPALVDSFKTHNLSMHNMVHATHDLTIMKPLKTNDVYTTSARIIGVEQKKPGIFLSWRIDTLDSAREIVTTTWQGNIFLGAKLNMPQLVIEPLPDVPTATKLLLVEQIPIGASSELAHTYTECARIWNPIHTEPSVARKSGMTKPLLHGTATLALCVSKIAKFFLEERANKMSRIGCRFSSPVVLPQELLLNILSKSEKIIHFELVAIDGRKVLDKAFVCLNP